MIYALALAYLVVAIIRAEPNSTLRIVAMGVGAVGMYFVFTQWFIPHFSAFISTVMAIGGIFMVVMITEKGFMGLALYAVVHFLVMRVKFINATAITLFVWFFFHIWMFLRFSIGYLDLLNFDFVFLCIILFAGYGGMCTHTASLCALVLQQFDCFLCSFVFF